MRAKRTASEWAALVQRHRDSGLTVREFCQDKGICPNLFYRKRRELSSEAQAFIRLPELPAGDPRSAQIQIDKIKITVSENTSAELMTKVIRSALEVSHACIS
jgi:transposase-like protein